MAIKWLLDKQDYRTMRTSGLSVGGKKNFKLGKSHKTETGYLLSWYFFHIFNRLPGPDLELLLRIND